jgi:hypothetical protein
LIRPDTSNINYSTHRHPKRASHARRLRDRTVIAVVLLASVSGAAYSQIAAEETLRLTSTVASPWGTPLGAPLPNGTTLQLTANALTGPPPLQCTDGRYVFVRSPAAGLFEGNLPAPAEQSARSLGMPEPIVTQRISCENSGFDLHRAADGRAWLGLDNTVLVWERVDLATTPEATVQSLLLHHAASGMSLSRSSLAAQQSWLSEPLLAAFDRWFRRSATRDEPPELNGDPYTDSQEPPEAFELSLARVRGDRAELKVTYRDAADARYAVDFELVRSKRSWRVNDVRLRNGQRLSQLLMR